MGPRMSKIYEQNPVNQVCPACQATGKLPNLAGRFHLINEKDCQCNGCKTVYPKSMFYKQVVTNTKLSEEPSF